MQPEPLLYLGMTNGCARSLVGKDPQGVLVGLKRGVVCAERASHIGWRPKRWGTCMREGGGLTQVGGIA